MDIARYELLAPDWRRNKHILVTEASALGSIAVIRSLGRAGYTVHACAPQPAALGMHSRFAIRSERHPGYSDRDFVPWLERYIARHEISAIVPSEGFLLAVREIFPRLQHLIAAGPDLPTLYRCFSKCDVHERLLHPDGDETVARNLPPTRTWRRGEALPERDELVSLGTPLFIKGDACYASDGRGGAIKRAATVQAAIEAIKQLSKAYSALLIQGFVPGTRVVADFCIWRGRVRSRSMMMARHESPHSGGISTLRSVGWDQRIWDDAERKLLRLGVEGVAMMEYRHDVRTGCFHFIEINARYWTGLHVEIGSGIDIPRLHLDAFFGVDAPVPETPDNPPLFRYTVPGEVGYVASLIKDPKVSVAKKIVAVLEFLWLGIDPRVKADLIFMGDSRLYFLGWWRFLRSVFRR